jgi:hypothetical protein
LFFLTLFFGFGFTFGGPGNALHPHPGI